MRMSEAGSSYVPMGGGNSAVGAIPIQGGSDEVAVCVELASSPRSLLPSSSTTVCDGAGFTAVPVHLSLHTDATGSPIIPVSALLQDQGWYQEYPLVSLGVESRILEMNSAEVKRLARSEIAYLLANNHYWPNSIRSMQPILPVDLYSGWRQALDTRLRGLTVELAAYPGALCRQRQRIIWMLEYLSALEALLQ